MDFDQIQPCRRADLIVVQRDSDARSNWVVKDPIQLNYYIFDEFQYWLFTKLTGNNSISTIAESFNQYFAPLRSSAEDVFAFCMQMSRDSLLNETATGGQIHDRIAKKNRGRWFKIPMSLLSLRLPTVNARGFFDFAENFLSWLFAPVVVLFTVCLLAFAGLLAFQEFDTFVSELPFIGQVRTLDVVAFLIALSLVKVLHELGHAICCRKMGAECNELGLMFLVFTPCLYCNVSDSWILPERWKRIAIVSAGIYIELIIASLALLGWNYCEQPFLRSFFLNLVLICSVNTLLVNGNPLMRYDGYFILSDLVNIPNLSSEARNTTWNLFCALLFKPVRKENDFHSTSGRIFLVSYYVLSVAYRWFILIAIFWLAYTKLKSVGLATFAIGLSSAYAMLTLGTFCFAFTKFVAQKNKREPKRWIGIILVISLLAGAIYFVSRIEISRDINADAMAEIDEYCFCSTPVSGTLVWTIQPNNNVSAGDLIARLENPDLANQRRKLQHEKKIVQLRIDNLETRGSVDSKSEFELPELRAKVIDLNGQLSRINEQIRRLSLRAPCDGQIIRWELPSPERSEQEFQSWQGSLLDPKNHGCFVEKGSVVCLVGEPSQVIVYLLIDERKLDLIDVGDSVKIMFPTQIGTRYSGSIAGFSKDSVIPFIDGVEQNATDRRTNVVRAIVELDQPVAFGLHGIRGKANISIDKETIGQIVRRFFIQTFRFDL